MLIMVYARTVHFFIRRLGVTHRSYLLATLPAYFHVNWRPMLVRGAHKVELDTWPSSFSHAPREVDSSRWIVKDKQISIRWRVSSEQAPVRTGVYHHFRTWTLTLRGAPGHTCSGGA